MATPNQPTPSTAAAPARKPDAPKPPSTAAKYFFMFLVGLLVGVIGLVMVLRAFEARKTPQDKWPDAVMNVMAVHSGALREAVQSNRCSATDLLPHLRTLREMTNDLEPAFPGRDGDSRFKEHAANMRATIDAAIESPPINCAGATSVQQRIGESCKACHQDFRG